MPVDIMATGFAGIAFETTAGTYVAPTKFFPIISESLAYTQDQNWRRPIRGLADILGVVGGPSHVEGDIEMEFLSDVAPYFLYASRNTVVKTGTAPYTYTTTPIHGALPTASAAGKPTLSITIVRDGAAFGYTGCVVSSQVYTTDNGVLKVTYTIQGRDEATQSVPTPTFSTETPFGHGLYTVSNPTGTPVLDVDTFSLQIEDNASGETRLSSTRAPQFVRFGERSVQLTMSRDFVDRTEYDTFKAYTSRSVTILASKAASNQVTFKVAGAIKDAYAISGLATQGDLVRADITYQGVYDTATSKAYEIIVTTPTENIV